MRRGDWRTAWAINDSVLAARDPSTRDDPRLPYHERWVWDGRPFRGRRVLVRCYHGLGDTLHFARYLAPLRAAVTELAMEAQPELLPLLERLPGIDRLIPFQPDAPTPPAECDIEIMELFHAMRLEPLRVPPPRIKAEAMPLPAALGVCWRAGEWDARRSVPRSDLLAALTGNPCVPLPYPPPPRKRGPRAGDVRLPWIPAFAGMTRTIGLRLLSLQRGPAALEATDPAFLNPADTSVDILRTASLIASARAVVTVDTMVAHLAGILRRPTLLLLHHAPDWRWMEAREDSPWYPSLRLLRQDRPGDWQGVLARLRHLTPGAAD